MSSCLSEKKLRLLASNLGEEWKAVATYLGIRRDEVERIQADHWGTEEQIFQMLMIWWQRWDHLNDGSDSIAVAALCESLVKSGRFDAAESLRGLIAQDFNFDVCLAEFTQYYIDTMGLVPLIPWLPSEVKRISDIYVKLKLIERENKAGRVVVRNINSYEDMLRLEYDNGQPVRFILLSGIAGTGKTTIVSKMATDWALQKPESPLSKFSLLVALSVRELKRVPDLGEGIFDQILAKDTNMCRTPLTNYLKSHAEEVLIVLDGADEFNEEGSELPTEGDIIDIISNKILRGCTVLVTTRPHMVDKLCKLNPAFTRIETSGFSDSGVQEYVQKIFKGEKTSVRADLYQVLMESKSLHTLARIPMMLLLICLIWSDERKLPETLTELFREAVFFMMKRHSEKFGKLCEKEDSLEHELMQFVQALGKPALDGLLLPGQKLIFESVEFGSAEMVDKACSLGILSLEKRRRKLRSVHYVTFLHKTLQEAIAGFYWASLFESDMESFYRYRRLLNEENAFNLEYVLRFCCGANVGAAESLLTCVTDVFSKTNPESSMSMESEHLPKSIVWTPISLEAKKERMVQRLWLLMHLEAQSWELHSIDKPMNRYRLIFNFDCSGDERIAFGYLIECASSARMSFLHEIQIVSMSAISGASATIVTEILLQGVMNITDLTIAFVDYKNEEAIHHWQLDLGKALSKMKLQTLSFCGPSVIVDYDISTVFEGLYNSNNSASLQNLTLESVAVNPRYLKKFLEKQGELRCITLRSQHDVDNRQVWGEALGGLQTQALQEMDVRQCVLSDSHEYCLDRSYPKLQILRLIDDDLQEDDIQHVSSLLLKSPKLKELDLSRNNIGRGIQSLAERFPHLDQLQVLKLTDTGLTSKEAITLAGYIPSLVNLQALSLSRYEYSPVIITAEALLTVLQWSCRCPLLKDLDIKQCVLTILDLDEADVSVDLKDGSQMLVDESRSSEGLADGPQMLADELHSSVDLADGLQTVAEEPYSLKGIEDGSQMLADESHSSEVLAEGPQMLAKEPYSSEDLAHGPQVLADEPHPTLKSTIENLDLSSNYFGKWTQQFLRLLKYMPFLKNLDMSSMSLTYADAVCLAEVLPYCQRLQTVHVGDNNQMGNRGLEVLLGVIPELPDLKYLSLPDRGRKPPEMVRECLQHGHRYSIIRYFHHFNRPQIEAVVQVVKRFKGKQNNVDKRAKLIFDV
ncbi:NACHT, LRR and PYD domains-containing protein 3-like [Acanthaster planci]|uniref:NACHT, LRR and PYD domains-containing protein 3-like n=1 Tax=Acanthaster planci TaxID=133434 RepID=A0A8B7YK85_ACAPL|nr:NACHT, LRR and PYD domains-containing protein 3-like [Acanthaster planci]XP_022092841.1 NACHT, LRR and PYD domains-containing protein 3-like [Acanthaster planci]